MADDLHFDHLAGTRRAQGQRLALRAVECAIETLKGVTVEAGFDEEWQFSWHVADLTVDPHARSSLLPASHHADYLRQRPVLHADWKQASRKIAYVSKRFNQRVANRLNILRVSSGIAERFEFEERQADILHGSVIELIADTSQVPLIHFADASIRVVGLFAQAFAFGLAKRQLCDAIDKDASFQSARSRHAEDQCDDDERNGSDE